MFHPERNLEPLSWLREFSRAEQQVLRKAQALLRVDWLQLPSTLTARLESHVFEDSRSHKDFSSGSLKSNGGIEVQTMNRATGGNEVCYSDFTSTLHPNGCLSLASGPYRSEVSCTRHQEYTGIRHHPHTSWHETAPESLTPRVTAWNQSQLGVQAIRVAHELQNYQNEYEQVLQSSEVPASDPGPRCVSSTFFDAESYYSTPQDPIAPLLMRGPLDGATLSAARPIAFEPAAVHHINGFGNYGDTHALNEANMPLFALSKFESDHTVPKSSPAFETEPQYQPDSISYVSSGFRTIPQVNVNFHANFVDMMSSHECSPALLSYQALQTASSIGGGLSSAQLDASNDDYPGVLTPISWNSHDVDKQHGSSSDNPPIIPSPDLSASMQDDSPETDVPPPSRKRKRRRAPFGTAEERAATALTRRLGACISCKLRRVRCFYNVNDPRGRCLTCLGSPGGPSSMLPCLRYKVLDVAVYSKGEHPQFIWSERWKKMRVVDINSWDSDVFKTISVTQGVGDSSYELRVRKFVPHTGDSLQRKWKTNGRQMCYDCTPYAIVDMAGTGKKLKKFVEDNLATSINYYIDDNDSLLRRTYAMASKYSHSAEQLEEKKLLRSVLRLWVAIRMESRSEWIRSEETLGMKPQDWDPDCDNYRQVLVPPVISAQIELMMTVFVLQPQKKDVLQGLQKLIEAKRNEYWFTIYLTIFILLHSCALLTRFERMQAKKHGLETRYACGKRVEELHNGAKVILAYYHHSCKASLPFAINWASPGNLTHAGLNAEQVEFVEETAAHVRANQAIFDDIRATGRFEHDLFFVSQLYDPKWNPIPTI